MDRSNYDATFEDFLAAISLTSTQASKIDGALAALSGIFLTKFEGDVEIYVQGSFATNTTVKPLTSSQSEYGPGEYDIDVVLERSSWNGAQDALNEIEQVMLSFEKYASRLTDEEKQSCIQLKYAPDRDTGVAFHVDLVPIMNDRGIKKVAIRDSDSWRVSDSLQLIAWTKRQQSLKPYISATVLMVKRLRDMYGLTNHLTSIILFSLLETCYQQTGSYADDLLLTLERMSTKLSVNTAQLEITNPVSREEDLIKKWRSDPSIHFSIRDFVNDAHDTLSRALANEDVSVLRTLFSDDFPSSILTPNVQSMRSIGVAVVGSPDLKKGAIGPSSRFGSKTHTNVWTFFERNKEINFVAVGPHRNETVLWQVVNDPSSEKVRGEFFESRSAGGKYGSSPDPLRNTENEQYPGRHWIRFIGFNEDNQLVTLGPKFMVHVRAAIPRFPGR
jgi:hypothetical protein